MALFAVLVGVFGAVVGWHWKLMHRSWQDIRLVSLQAKGKIPALKALRSHHTSKALVFGLIVVVVVAAIIH